MPFKSDAQRKFLFAKHPSVAKEFAAATPKGKKLPEHVHSREEHMKPPKMPMRGKSASAPGQLKKAQGLQNASSIAKAKRPEEPKRRTPDLPKAEFKKATLKPAIPPMKTPPTMKAKPAEVAEPRLPIAAKTRYPARQTT